MADVDSSSAEVTVSPAPDVNDTEGVVNGTTGKIPATPEGMALAYGSLMIMAMIPILFGSFRSITSHKEQKEASSLTGEKPETLTKKDAAMFPVIASCALFGLYVFFQIVSKEHVNLLLSIYFFFLGIFAVTHMVAPTVNRLAPKNLFGGTKRYRLELFAKGEGDGEGGGEGVDEGDAPAKDPSSPREEVFAYDFTVYDLAVLACSALIGAWYLVKKHWLANNLFGMAFAVNGVELLHLNKVVTGCILLGGLFFYDIFWVFGTDVMVTVAKSFDAPIKLVFPQDLLENGLGATNMAMLGLGDIVIPGIFIALLLRYDQSLKRGNNFYFWTGFLAYFLGLCTTMVVMHYFKHAQPALLYLVPACLGAPIFTASVCGDVVSMFAYADHPEEEENETKKTS